MRHILSALALATLTLASAACSEDEAAPAPTACVAIEGETALALSCGGVSPGNDAELEALHAYRLHMVRATSASAAAGRFMHAFAAAGAECMGRALAATFFGPVMVALTGEPIDQVTCDDLYAGSTSDTFREGTYTFYAESRGGSAASDSRVDTRARATLRFYLTRDAGDLKKGDLVPVDVRRADAYLVGARVVTTSDGGVAIAYDRPGPLAALLDQGEDPPNPIKLTKGAQTSLARAFEVEGSVHSDLSDCGEPYRTVTDLDLPRAPITARARPRLVSSLLTGPGVRVEARALDATQTAKADATGLLDASVEGLAGVKAARVDLADGKLTIECGR